MVTVVKNKFQAKLELNLNPLLFSSWEISKQLKNNAESKKQKRAAGILQNLKPIENIPVVQNEYDICT